MKHGKIYNFVCIFEFRQHYRCLQRLSHVSLHLQHKLFMLCASRRALQLEEEYIKQMCDEIIAVKPDLIFTEKGVSGNDMN